MNKDFLPRDSLNLDVARQAALKAPDLRGLRPRSLRQTKIGHSHLMLYHDFVEGLSMACETKRLFPS
jgi:hypothetical protein